MKHLVLIKNDLFGVVKRVRRINKNLFIYLNQKTKTYQIYSKKGIAFLFENDLGKTLDQNAIILVQKNRIENINNIVAKIDLENLKKEKTEKERINDFAKNVLKDFITFADKKNQDVDFSKFKIGGRNDS